MGNIHFLLRTALLTAVGIGYCFLFTAKNAGATWNMIAQFDPAVQGLPTVIYFIDGKTGFLGFGNPSTPLWRTGDSGVTWAPATSPSASSGYISDIWFGAPGDGWTTIADDGGMGMLWHSNDTGNTWTLVGAFQTPLFNDPSSIRKTSNLLCVAGTKFGVAYSTDNGTTFTESNCTAQMRGLDFVDDLHIVSTPSYEANNYYYSSNGGTSWNSIPTLGGDSWGVIGIKGASTYFVAPENRPAVSTPSSVFRSDDYGAHWNSISILSFKTTGDIEGDKCSLFIQNSDSLQGQPLGIYRSTDEGITWTNIGGPSNSMDSRFAVLNGGEIIYAFDENDDLWKTTDGGDGFAGTGISALSLDTSMINLGTAIACQTYDTEIVYTNTGCVPVNVNSWSMSQWSTGFNVSGTGNSPPIHLAVGQSDSLHITYTSGSGHIYDTVVMTSNAANGPVWRIPVEINITPQDSVQFTVAVNPDPIKPGDTLTVTISPNRAVQGLGLKRITGTLEYYSDSYDFVSATGGAGSAAFQYTPPYTVGKTAHLPFTISSPTDISLDPRTPVLTVLLVAMLSDTSVNDLVLDSLMLNDSDPNYENCILGASANSALSHILFGCGDSILILTLRNQLAFDVENPQPDPITSEDGYQSTLTLHSASDGIAEVRVTDMLGRMVANNTIPLSAGETANYSLDLSHEPSGSYFYAVQFSSQYGVATKSGTVMVLR